MNQQKILRGRNLIVLWLGICTGVLSLLLTAQSRQEFFAGILSNLSAGFFTTLLLYVLVEALVEESANRRSAHLREMGYKRAWIVAMGFAEGVRAMIKAASPPDSFPSTRTFQELLTPSAATILKDIDLYAETEVVGKRCWAELIEARTAISANAAESLLTHYLTHLDPELITGFESLLSDPYFYVLKNIDSIRKDVLEEATDHRIDLGSANWPTGDDYLRALVCVCDLISKETKQEFLVPSEEPERSLPRTGSARILRQK